MLQEKEMKRSDDVFTHKPKFIQRSHDKMILLSYDAMLVLLEGYTLTIKKYVEEDGSITLSLNEIDLIENAKNEEEAKRKLGKAVLEYASDYYNDYELYSKSPNRKNQLPYIIKALIIDDPERIGSLLVCKSTVMQKHQKTQMVATPVLEGKDAISAIKAANRKPSDASRKGAKILAEKFEEMIKE